MRPTASTQRKNLGNFIKNTKVVIFGFGSIGQRHCVNIIKSGVKKENIVIIDPYCKEPGDIELVRDITKVDFKIYDIALICSPTSLHVPHALRAAREGCHLFIEKPLSHSLQNVKKLIQICRQKKLVTMVACNMRFHPCIQYIKNALDKGRIGAVSSIDHEYGQYLPYWRPKQDYRIGYAARKETGGGVIFDVMHEFDLLFWMNNFTQVKKSSFLFDKVSNLEIKTEDICFATFQFINKVFGLIRIDYLQKHYSRTAKVVGEKGNIEWDWNENIVWFKSRNKTKKLFVLKKYDTNQMYIDEINYFLDCVLKNKKTCNDIARAKNVLAYCVKRRGG